jgi:hypothetical protein
VRTDLESLPGRPRRAWAAVSGVLLTGRSQPGASVEPAFASAWRPSRRDEVATPNGDGKGNHRDPAERLHNWLAKIASETSAPLLAGQVGVLIDIPRAALETCLEAVQDLCEAQGEPNLASMVVYRRTRAVINGYRGPDPRAERERCADYFSTARKADGWREWFGNA